MSRTARLGRSLSLLSSLALPASGELLGRWAERNALLGADGYVYDLAVFRGELIAAGRFHRIGGISANGLARFDGAQWYAFGSGIERLDAAGVPATDAWAENLFVYQDDLIVAGRFTHAGGAPAPYVVRWDGERFVPLGLGTDSRVASIATNNGDLVIGGFFSRADGILVNRVSTFAAGGWRAMDRGFSAGVTALYEFQGELWAGGLFMQTGNRVARGVATWADGIWMGVNPGFVSLSLSDPAVIFNFGEHAGELYAAGHFHRWGDSVRVTGVARWTGVEWVALGTGLSTPGGSAWGSNLLSYDGELIVVGKMERAGGTIVQNIASFDGLNWAPLGLGTDGEVKSCVLFREELYISGLFQHAGSRAADYVAVWVPAPAPAPPTPVVTQLKLHFYPNPSWDAATIQTELVAGARGSLELFDARGRVVRSWPSGQLGSGRSELPFDGRDAAGRVLAAGIYRLRLTTANQSRTISVALGQR